MTAAVARVGEIDRGQCRAAAERRFSLARMAADYERLYRVILHIPASRRPSGLERAHCDRICGPGPSLKCFSSRTYAAAISG